ncbi:MAG: patatin-like phospholipase family protein [Planctomycetota bacterium]
MHPRPASIPARAPFLPLLLAALGTVACGSVPDRNPPPADLAMECVIPGIPEARSWGDEKMPWFDETLDLGAAELRVRFPGVFGRPHNYLAISGGGENGAFGAGILCGWTARGDRPEFQMVTGISTGALSAPFAFLGPAYDARLEEIYTTYHTKDLLEERSLLTAVTSDAFADTAPLARMIAKYMTQEVLDAIAVESRKGRALWIATTNLDASRPVIWNIGKIATSGRPERLALFHKVLLASASIPIAFPPVYFEVEARGKRYDELHVDGGATTQVFLYPLGIDWSEVLTKLEVPGKPQVYVIRNAWIQPKWEAVNPGSLAAIAGRTTSSMIRTQGLGDMYRMYLGALRDGLDYHLAYMPRDFDHAMAEPFDPAYMKALFDRGYAMAKAGYPWDREPPGLTLR